MTNREKYTALKQGTRSDGILSISALYQVRPENDPYSMFDNYSYVQKYWKCDVDLMFRPSRPALYTLEHWRDEFSFPIPTYDELKVDALSEFRSTPEGLDSLIIHTIDGILYRLWCVVDEYYLNDIKTQDPGILQGFIDGLLDDYFIPRLKQYDEIPCDVIIFRDDILDSKGKYDQHLWEVFLKPAYRRLCQTTSKDVWFHDEAVYPETFVEDLSDCGFVAICGVYDNLNVTLANVKNRLLVLGGSDFLYNCEQRQFDLVNGEHVGKHILKSKVFFDKYVNFIPHHNSAIRPHTDDIVNSIAEATKDWAGQPSPITDWTPIRDPYVEPTTEELIDTLLDGIL